MRLIRRMGRWIYSRVSPRLRTPANMFGQCVTLYGWGLDVRLPWTILVVAWNGRWRAYLSDNGTPGRAHRWFFGRRAED